MATFKDNQGRSWTLTVNVHTAKRVKSVSGVDIFKIFNGDSLDILSDPATLVDVIYELVDGDKKGPKDFGESLTGDAFEAATEALLEAVSDFFPSSRRQVLKLMAAKGKMIATQAMAMQMTALESVSLESLQAAITSPGVSESTPDPSPSAN